MKVQFMHFRPASKNDSRGGATVAICPTEGNKVLVSVALCGSNDVFNKKRGRDISSGRIRAALEGRMSMEGLVSAQRRTALVHHVREIEVTDLMHMKESVAKVMSPEMAEFGLV